MNAYRTGEGADLASDIAGPVRVSVVLPVHNGEPYLAEQLAALVAQKTSFRWELLVVNNCSTDGTARVAEGFGLAARNLRILYEPQKGKSYALNTGRAAAAGELLILVDADDLVGPGYLEAMAAALGDYEMVSGRIDTTTLNPPGMQEEYLSPNRIGTWFEFLPYIGGGLMGIRASTWDRLGGFATDLLSLEDVEFTWRASLDGVTLGMAPSAVLHFRRPTSVWKNFRKARSYARGSVVLYHRYRSKGQPRISILVDAHNIRLAIREFTHHAPRWRWRLMYRLGLVEGRLEESLRRRVWYP